MRTVKDILPALRNEAPGLATVVPIKPDEGTVSVINALFRELQSIFPAWKQAWPDKPALDAAKATWTKAFMSERINRIEQIRFGIEQCRKLATPFAPSVGEFIAMCQPTPEMLGIPTRIKAFREALLNLHASSRGSRVWSHPAIRHASLQCEMYNLSELTPEKAAKVFDRAYDITIRMLVQGQPLEDIAIGIGHDSQKPESELAREYGDARLLATMRLQGVPLDGNSAREQLMAKFGRRTAQ